MSHSPAPWTLSTKKPYPTAHKHQEITDAAGRVLFADETYYPTASENKADWPLVSAAPELLAALKYLLELGGDDDRRIAAEAAIAKAEGRS